MFRNRHHELEHVSARPMSLDERVAWLEVRVSRHEFWLQRAIGAIGLICFALSVVAAVSALVK